ncbi:MAG TPA: hypothetical protein VKQ32_00270 [Polyangia bacterium]|nr:hypothetical protein [Polyangia bacterium]
MRARVVADGLLVLFVSSCATKMYEGRELLHSESATIKTEGTRLERVDSLYAPAGDAIFTIAPGMHLVTFFLDDNPPPGGKWRRTSAESLAVCWDAQVRHLYRVRPAYDGEQWKPEVIDATTNAVIPTVAMLPAPTRCFPNGAGAGLSSSTLSVLERSGAPPEQIESVRAQLEPQPGASRVRFQNETEISAGAAPIVPRAPNPTFTLHFDTGYAAGGNDLVNISFSNGESRTLSAGDGVYLTVGVDWTPVWISGVVGLGVGGSFGFKYANVGASNGSVSLMRLPIAGTAHGMVRLGPKWFLLVRGGVEKDTNAALSGDGDAQLPTISLASNLGALAEVGPGFVNANHVGMTVTARLTVIDYTAGSQIIHASNFGIMVGGALHLWGEGANEKSH